MKNNLLATVTIACSIAAAQPALSAADGESATHRTESGTFESVQLPGDTKPTTLTTLWEVELANPDGNQNQMSMAKCGDNLFVCISYFDDIDNRTEKLFLRSYSAINGTGSEMAIDLPEDFHTGAENHHTIASDSEGNLVAMLISGSKTISTENVTLTMYRVDTDNHTIDTDSRTEINIPAKVMFNSSDDYNPWMERIEQLEGDFRGGFFSLTATIGWRTNTTHFEYTRFHITYDIENPQPATIADRQTLAIESSANENRNLWPDVAQLSNGIYVVTRTCEDTGGPYYPPTIYAYPDGKTADNLAANWVSNADMAHCRGFYPFTHNGHTLAILGQHHDTSDTGKGATYSIISLPDKTSFNGHTTIFNLPAKAFPSGSTAHPIYSRFYRQLAIAEPQSATAISNNDTPQTNIYICSPGCGIGAYTLKTSADIPTSLPSITDPASHNTPTPQLRGRTLHLPSAFADLSTAEAYNATGHHLATLPASASQIDLSPLSPGLYILRLGTTALKVSLH